MTFSGTFPAASSAVCESAQAVRLKPLLDARGGAEAAERGSWDTSGLPPTGYRLPPVSGVAFGLVPRQCLGGRPGVLGQ
jgi:hypothetical protein